MYAVLLVYLLLPSLPLSLFAHKLGLMPVGYINLEYLLIGSFGVFLPRSVVFVLLFLESLADIASPLCWTYLFSFEGLFSAFRSLPALPGYRILEMLAGLALVILICALVALARPRPNERFWTAGGLLVMVAILTLGAFFAGQNVFWTSDVSYFPHHLVRSPIRSLAVWKTNLDHKDFASRHPNSSEMHSASSDAIALLDRPGAVKSPDMILILVESWGLPLDADLAKALTAPYDDDRVARKYKVSYGTVPFDGGTVPAEARELCNSRIGFGILAASVAYMKGCLPTLFHNRGYKSFSVHGYSDWMFQRSQWYRNIGFDQSWFGPNLDRAGLPRCGGAFPGTCDASIAGWIGSSILSVDDDKPKFVYWVTLNSHLPVPVHPNLPDDGICGTNTSLRDSAPLCSWFRLVRAVHQSVQLLALRPSTRPAVIVLVGDHAPPFADPQLRQNFSATDVPYVILTPKMAITTNIQGTGLVDSFHTNEARTQGARSGTR